MPIDESHPTMKTPKTNITLWRYMDIPSFVSLLVDESLTFVRADLFDDKFEGKLPKMTSSSIDVEARKQIEAGTLKKEYWNLSEILNKFSKNTYLNCWCNETHELVNMWKIYSKENGVAIETNYEFLKESILSSESIYPTEIRYLDFQTDFVPWGADALKVYSLKRKEYKSENEFRLILFFPRSIEDQLLRYNSYEEMILARPNLYLNTPVVKCKVSISKLVKKIHVSPYAPKWYLDIIKGLAQKYNLNAESITQSDL